MDTPKPPDIGVINTTPPMAELSPEEAEVRRLERLAREHNKKAMEVQQQLIAARRIHMRKELLTAKARGLLTSEGEELLNGLSGDT